MQSAAAFLRETRMSPLSMVTSQRSVRLPSAMSKRALPLAFSSSGSCPRRPSSAKNSAIESDVCGCFLPHAANLVTADGNGVVRTG